MAVAGLTGETVVPDLRSDLLYLSDLPPDLRVVLSLALDVARGMAHLHSGNVVHAGKALADRPQPVPDRLVHVSLRWGDAALRQCGACG